MHRLALWAALAACSSPVTPKVGELPADRLPLREAPPLAHLEPVYGEGATVADLFDRDRDPAARPDPASWQALMASDMAALPALDDGVSLRVLSWNVALLDRPYLFTRVKMPFGPERRAAQLATLFDDGWDIILLQELWEWDDTQAFVTAAAQAGYQAWPGTEKRSERHGAAIFVRASVVGETLDQAEVLFDDQRKVERWPGPKIKRGYLQWSFTLAGTDQTLTVVNTHMSAFYDFWHVRDRQARQLGVALSASPGIGLLGGDVNAAPYYAADTWVDGLGEEHAGFYRNATALPLLAWYGQAYDAFAAMGPPGDIEAAHAVPNVGGPQALAAPFGDPSICEDPAVVGVHTATDCNRTYFESYAGEEPPGRIDHLLVRDPVARVRVLDRGIAYTELIAGETFEPSDHYGVWVELRVQR
jgi:endonuclease/exonuclease/phosphatase family metal-dependent hydrolase